MQLFNVAKSLALWSVAAILKSKYSLAVGCINYFHCPAPDNEAN